VLWSSRKPAFESLHEYSRVRRLLLGLQTDNARRSNRPTWFLSGMWNGLPNDVVEAETIGTFKNRLDKHIGLIKMFFSIFMPTLLELEIYRFVCDLYTIHNAGKEDYTCARQNSLIGLDGRRSSIVVYPTMIDGGSRQ